MQTTTHQPQSRCPDERTENPEDFLASSESDSEDDSGVRLVRVRDQGSRPRCAKVEIQGVPAFGIVDSESDITIIGGELFKKVAAVAKLRKRDLKSDKSPHNYDGQPFILDGRLDLDISFKGKSMCTPVYIKMNALDQLLLSEGVCRQLGILTYDSDVQVWRGGRRRRYHWREPTNPLTTAKVPTVRARLVQTSRLPPRQSSVVRVRVEKGLYAKEPLLIEADSRWERTMGLEIATTLVQPDKHGQAHILITNPRGYTQYIQRGAGMGRASTADVVTPSRDQTGETLLVEAASTQEADGTTLQRPPLEGQGPPEDLLTKSGEPVSEPLTVQRVMSRDKDLHRRDKLLELLPKEESYLSEEDQSKVYTTLLDRHNAFAVEEGERGETDLLQMEIETGDATPVRQHPRRLPFAVRQEVAQQLRIMQGTGGKQSLDQSDRLGTKERWITKTLY